MKESKCVLVNKLLINVNSISLNFNLREPKCNKTTNVYAVVRIGNSQFKYPTGCMINSWQWNKKKQIPVLEGNMTTVDYSNSLRVFWILSQIRLDFLKYYSYLCTCPETKTVAEIRESIKQLVVSKINDVDMNDDNLSKNVVRTPKASTLLNKAFDLYYNIFRPKIKEISKSREKGKLNAFINYCDENDINKCSSLSQKVLNKYQKYLIDKSKKLGSKGDSNNTINGKCRVVARMINFMVGHDSFSRYKLTKVEYLALEEFHAKGVDKKRRPLTNGELDKLMSCEVLSDKEKEYRDLFILECCAGYRVSDTPKLFDSSMQRFHSKNGNDYITIVPQKEETKRIIAVIWLNEMVKSILKRYKNGFKYAEINKKSYSGNLIYNLRNIFKKAALNSTEERIDAKGNKCEDKLSNIISSHFARYTFIYNGLFTYGFTPDELKEFTGHADDTMINEVYKVYSEEDKVAVADKALNRVMAKKDKSTPVVQQSTTVTSLLDEQFAYNLLFIIKDEMNNNKDVFHEDSTKQAIAIIKDISKLVYCPKDVEINKALELDQIVFELSFYFHDTELYSTYKYKEHYFGLEVDVPSTDEVEAMFVQEDIDRPKKQIQADIEAWENHK